MIVEGQTLGSARAEERGTARAGQAADRGRRRRGGCTLTGEQCAVACSHASTVLCNLLTRRINHVGRTDSSRIGAETTSTRRTRCWRRSRPRPSGRNGGCPLTSTRRKVSSQAHCRLRRLQQRDIGARKLTIPLPTLLFHPHARPTSRGEPSVLLGAKQRALRGHGLRRGRARLRFERRSLRAAAEQRRLWLARDSGDRERRRWRWYRVWGGGDNRRRRRRWDGRRCGRRRDGDDGVLAQDADAAQSLLVPEPSERVQERERRGSRGRRDRRDAR